MVGDPGKEGGAGDGGKEDLGKGKEIGVDSGKEAGGEV